MLKQIVSTLLFGFPEYDMTRTCNFRWGLPLPTTLKGLECVSVKTLLIEIIIVRSNYGLGGGLKLLVGIKST